MESNQPKKGLFRVDVLLSCLLAVTLIAVFQKIEDYANTKDQQLHYTQNNASKIFGFDPFQYKISSYQVNKNEVLGNILSEQGVASQLIQKIEDKAEDIFSVKKIKAGNEYHLVRTDECSQPIALVYEPNPLHYVVYNFKDDVSVSLYEREVETCIETTSGSIAGTLWGTLEEQNVNPSIIDNMEDALASSVDFYHTQEGDEFKLIYEKKYVEGKELGLGKLLGAYYKNSTGTHYSVYYKNGEFDGYYDYQGRPARAMFLKAPVKFTRISSKFSSNRFHPIRRMNIPHLGTDYAAPYGTPIRAVGDGVVEAASYTGGNGKFVKIKHDGTYQTQYLHMQGFAKGIRKGVRVRQGETIGYVGATGLATGPHVCFRFWKNGQQINHLKEVFEPAKPMSEKELPSFFQYRDKIKANLDKLAIKKPGSRA